MRQIFPGIPAVCKTLERVDSSTLQSSLFFFAYFATLCIDIQGLTLLPTPPAFQAQALLRRPQCLGLLLLLVYYLPAE